MVDTTWKLSWQRARNHEGVTRGARQRQAVRAEVPVLGDEEEQLGIAPRLLLVPAQLEEAAYDMFRRDTNNDETFTQSQKPKILVPWYWTDANDWVAMADKNDIPSIEVGFLDGQEEPEMFVQDNPTVGSLFTNDTITYKIRHIYGGVVKDFRGAVKSVVA